MSEDQSKNQEPSLPPLGLTRHATQEPTAQDMTEEATSLDLTKGKSLGALIREAREAKGLSTADLAQSLNLDRKIVERIEANQFEEGPEPIYVRAYLKHWATLVGVDPQVWLDAYQLQRGGHTDHGTIGVTAPVDVMSTRKAGRAVNTAHQGHLGRTLWRLLLILIAAVVLLAIIAVALPGVWQKGLSLITPKKAQNTTITLNEKTAAHAVSLPIQPLPALSDHKNASGQNSSEQTLSGQPPSNKAPSGSPDTTPAGNAVPPPPPPMTLPANPTGNASVVSPSAAGTPSSGAAVEATAKSGATTTPTAQSGSAPITQPSTAQEGSQAENLANNQAENKAGNLVIKVNSADCWVEVRNAKGKRLVYDVLKKGEEKTVPGNGPFTITLGNPNAVTVLWKGKPVALGAANSTTGVVRTTVGGS